MQLDTVPLRRLLGALLTQSVCLFGAFPFRGPSVNRFLSLSLSLSPPSFSMALHPRRLQSGKRLGREEEGQAAESFSQRVFFALVSKQCTDMSEKAKDKL